MIRTGGGACGSLCGPRCPHVVPPPCVDELPLLCVSVRGVGRQLLPEHVELLQLLLQSDGRPAEEDPQQRPVKTPGYSARTSSHQGGIFRVQRAPNLAPRLEHKYERPFEGQNLWVATQGRQRASLTQCFLKTPLAVKLLSTRGGQTL